MIDRAEIIVFGGDGGNGVVSFRREKFVPRGGPNGGDGGNGGNVLLLADPSVRTLKELGRRRTYRAQRGAHGQGSDRHGRNGEDLVIRVPIGTEVRRRLADGEEEKVGDLVDAGQFLVAAKGGLGGWGNARFATSVRRAPRIAQRGQAGEEAHLVLDLKLLADVGLVGLPNAGKSTLLATISHARPKIADYPFTTLEPALGVVDVGYDRFVVADIPGLIEGAHLGAGLGLDFLRHIERTRVILHLVDGSASQPLRDFDLVNAELKEYGHGLAERRQVVAITKVDLPEVEARRHELKAAFEGRGIQPIFISSATREGIPESVETVWTVLRGELPASEEQPPPEEERTVQPRATGQDFTVRREDSIFVVHGERPVAFAEMMPVEQEEALQELWSRFTRWGVVSALKRAGAKSGDTVRFGRVEVELPG